MNRCVGGPTSLRASGPRFPLAQSSVVGAESFRRTRAQSAAPKASASLSSPRFSSAWSGVWDRSPQGHVAGTKTHCDHAIPSRARQGQVEVLEDDMPDQRASSASTPPPGSARVRRSASASPPPASDGRKELIGAAPKQAARRGTGRRCGGTGARPRISSRESWKVPCARKTPNPRRISKVLLAGARSPPGAEARAWARIPGVTLAIVSRVASTGCGGRPAGGGAREREQLMPIGLTADPQATHRGAGLHSSKRFQLSKAVALWLVERSDAFAWAGWAKGERRSGR
jgi:hypothetical protein